MYVHECEYVCITLWYVYVTLYTNVHSKLLLCVRRHEDMHCYFVIIVLFGLYSQNRRSMAILEQFHCATG
jgi:hypothetical protein